MGPPIFGKSLLIARERRRRETSRSFSEAGALGTTIANRSKPAASPGWSFYVGLSIELNRALLDYSCYDSLKKSEVSMTPLRMVRQRERENVDPK